MNNGLGLNERELIAFVNFLEVLDDEAVDRIIEENELEITSREVETVLDTVYSWIKKQKKIDIKEG